MQKGGLRVTAARDMPGTVGRWTFSEGLREASKSRLDGPANPPEAPPPPHLHQEADLGMQGALHSRASLEVEVPHVPLCFPANAIIPLAYDQLQLFLHARPHRLLDPTRLPPRGVCSAVAVSLAVLLLLEVLPLPQINAVKKIIFFRAWAAAAAAEDRHQWERGRQM